MLFIVLWNMFLSDPSSICEPDVPVELAQRVLDRDAALDGNPGLSVAEFCEVED